MSHIYKSQLFDHLKLIFLKNSKCIMFPQDHRTQLWHYLTKKKNFIATLKLIQSLRKCTCKYLRVSLLNTVSFEKNQASSFYVA